MIGLLNLEYYIYLQFTFMLQLFSCQLIMTPKTTEKRVHFKWLLVLKIIIDTTVAFIAYLYQFFFESTFINTLIIYLGMYAFSCLSYLFIFDATFKDAIYVTSIGYVFQHIAYKCNSLIFDTGDNLKIQSNAYQGIYPSYSNQVTMISDGILLNYLINILEQFAVYMLIDLILYFIFAKKFKRNYVNTLSSTYTITISITSLLITILIILYLRP